MGNLALPLIGSAVTVRAAVAQDLAAGIAWKAMQT